MHSTRLSVLDHDPAALDALWDALEPEAGPRTPRVRAVMISSVDGRTTIDGRSAGLGTPTDQLVFHAMRARADFVLVGSGTVLSEGYGPAQIAEVWASRRDTPPPEILVLTRSLSDTLVDHCVHSAHSARTGPGMAIVADHRAPADRVELARRRGITVHVLPPGPTGAGVRSLLAELGAAEVAFEGGPRALGALLADGAVDELVLSIAPQLVVGGDVTPLAEGPELTRIPMRVASAFTCPQGGLYTRWIITGDHL